MQSALKAQIERLTAEVQSAVEDAARFPRSSARSSMGKMELAIERQLQRDLRVRRERLQNAKRLLAQAESREHCIAESLARALTDREASSIHRLTESL